MTIDTATYQTFQQIQNPILTAFAKIIAVITEPKVIAIIAIITTICLYVNKKKNQSILLGTTTIITVIITEILKAIIQRPRPISTLIQETGFSFPSGHTTMAIVFLGVMAYIFTKKKNKTKVVITSTLLLIIIGLSRLYLQVHWLTDIIGGLIIGGIILTASILIYKKITSS